MSELNANEIVSNLKKNIINTICPADDLLISYYHKELNNSELQAISIHIKNCEMCSDFIEGYSLIDDKEKLEITVSAINQDVTKLIEKKTSSKLLNFKVLISIAAIFIIFIGISYFLLTSINKDKAFDSAVSQAINKESPSPESNYLPKSSSESDDFTTQKEEKKSIQVKTYKKKEVKNNIANDEVQITDNKQVNEILDIPAIAPVSKIVDNNTTEADDEVKPQDILAEESVLQEDVEVIPLSDMDKGIKKDESGEEKAASRVKKERKKSREVAPGKVERENVNYAIDSALYYYNKQQYLQSIKHFEQCDTQNIDNEEYTFYMAKCYFEIKNYSKAIDLTNKILLKKNSNYYPDAQYYKALSLLFSDQKEKGIELLKIIISSEGKYSNDAKKHFIE